MSSGTQYRDFLHVFDLCRFIELVIEKIPCRDLPIVFNISSGKSYSVRSIAAYAYQLNQLDYHSFLCRNKSDCLHPSYYISNFLATEITGWKPTYPLLPALHYSSNFK